MPAAVAVRRKAAFSAPSDGCCHPRPAGRPARRTRAGPLPRPNRDRILRACAPPPKIDSASAPTTSNAKFRPFMDLSPFESPSQWSRAALFAFVLYPSSTKIARPRLSDDARANRSPQRRDAPTHVFAQRRHAREQEGTSTFPAASRTLSTYRLVHRRRVARADRSSGAAAARAGRVAGVLSRGGRRARCAARPLPASEWETDAGAVHGGRLTCPYHGWAYDGAGRVVAIPRRARFRPCAIHPTRSRSATGTSTCD